MKICLSKSYPNKTVFEKLEVDIPERKILCVMGESGAGKTTLLNLLAGLIDNEEEVLKIERVSYLFQTPRLLPSLSVRENLLYTAEESTSNAQIDNILNELELSSCADRKAKNLSGGEKQRVAIARAFLSSAEWLLMDEPFSSLDVALRLRLVSIFKKTWEKDKKTTVFVTHDIEEALMLADTILVLKEGENPNSSI